MKVLQGFILTLLVGFSTALVAKPSPQGWTIGFGGVTAEQGSASIFPTVDIGSQTLMLLPNISYTKDQWKFGSDGIMWSGSNNAGYEVEVSAGFPMSAVRVTKTDEWRSYSAESGLNYADGLLHHIELTALGLSYRYTYGLEDRNNQLQHQFSFQIPVYIARDERLLLFATGAYDQSNGNFVLNNQTSNDNALYATKSLGVFVVRTINDKSSVVGSVQVQNPENRLLQLQPDMDEYPMKVFFMYSYHLGK